MCIRDRYQPYVASSTTSGHWPARAITDANRCTSLTIRTVSSTSPASVVRTITVLRRCRSIPTNCFPAYASIRGLLALSHGTLTLPSIHAGRRRWEREEAPLLHHIRGPFSTWWQVKDSNLRSFRDGFTDHGRQARDQRKRPFHRQLTCAFPTDSRPQPDIPMRLEESWRTASSRRPNARPDLRAHPRPPAVPPRESYGTVVVG